ncbi:uncharacterized protein LOC122984182 [Thunnus albacares]|uniref:uncharacterized protein LOC122984182 n=1 Tax=Thunnus albacares TaxID=8236 RepID=UPI001CF695D7|nr:uncharacterized protein LOC122984182 [Thunnus albacares]
MEAVVGLLVMLLGVSHAPVSSVLLDSECLSQGETRVSCSSEGGDSPQYSWTLDGHTLTDAQLLSGNNETNNITLKQDVSGLLVCSVRNHVSNVSKGEKISTCGFIFINCTLPDGTNISQWMFSANNTLCIDPTTTPTMIMITDTMASNVDNSLLVSVLRAVVALSLLGGIAIYFAWKKKKYKKAETSTRPRIKDHPENSFEMVEL